DFRLLFGGSVVSGFVMPMQFLTQIFWIQDHYPDRQVLYVGLIAASRGSAMLLFSFVGGAFADRFERRRVLLACESTGLTISVLVALLMLASPFGGWTIAVLLLLAFAAAANLAVDMPARTASIPSVVGMADLSNAIGLATIGQQLAFPVAILITGALNDRFGSGQVYAGSLLAWVLILPMIAALRFHSAGGARPAAGMLRNVAQGLKYTRRDATIFAVISIVVVTQAIGMPGPATLGPVWMTKILGLTKAQFGLMGMTWGVGTLAASFFFAYRHDLVRKGSTLCAMTLLFSVCAVGFAYSRFIPLTAVVNFGLGFALIGTMVSSTTIVQHTVSEEMRGRVMGLFPLAMGLSMLNGAPVSAAGQWLGLEVVFPILAWATLLLSALIIFGRPALRRVDPGTRVGAESRVPSPEF
ncbi:MAG: hypothetical protein C0506_09825, partial [Anaerolinea sp.]|nr:hypothetical protein [Anaerolinea sp.]